MSSADDGRWGIDLFDSAAARAADAAAVEAGDRWAGLMGTAAGHLARGVWQAGGARPGMRVVVVAGKGNNGGDGWAAATRLAVRGAHCVVASVVEVDTPVSDETAAHRDRWIAAGGRIVVGVDAVRAALARLATVDGPAVVVDCLLGTGIDGAPRGDVGDACAAINAARNALGGGEVRVVACDVPSGVSADTGQAPGDAVWADWTVTMGGEKRGLLLQPGGAHAGRVVVGGLGPHHRMPPPRAGEQRWRTLTAASAAPPRLTVTDDKRRRGTVLVVAGSAGTAGAAILAARGALAAGAGLVTLAVPASVQPLVAPAVPSAMTRSLADRDGQVAAEAVDDLHDVGQFDAVVAGPGLGPTGGTRAVVDHLRASARRLVLDADAINVHRDDPAALAEHHGALVLTPHARELARLGAGDDGDDAGDHRVVRVPALAASLDATVVAKGPGTIIAGPDGACWVSPVGGPELGTGGTGDVLAGMVAAGVAGASDGMPLAAIVARTVFWHGFAGGWLAAGRPNAADLAAGHGSGRARGARLAQGDGLTRGGAQGSGAEVDPSGAPRGDRDLPMGRAGAHGTAAPFGAVHLPGFGPSSALPDALPEAMRVLVQLAQLRPWWPREMPW